MTSINAALRQELLDMAARDQAMRQTMSSKYRPGDRLDPAEAQQALALDRENTARLKAIIAELGWPGVSVVGDDGANAAWLLAQHADLDLAFQKQCLALLGAAVAAGEAAGWSLAYLTDRVRLSEGRPQVYGTQLRLVNGEFAAGALEDEAAVDERRASVGLEPLSMEVATARRLQRGE